MTNQRNEKVRKVMNMHKPTVGLTGSSGLIGQALKAELLKRDFRVRCFVRRKTLNAEEIEWDPMGERLHLSDNEPLDAIINLAGEPVLGRWTEAKRRRILDSRVYGTSLLAKWVSNQNTRCTLISASAIGIYGVAAHEVHHEESSWGDGFLADVCKAWEHAAEPARLADQRVVHPRIGLVLDPKGGALNKMLPAFRMGLGGPIGSGEQWNSWITLDDLVGVLVQCVTDSTLVGPINCVAPNPVQNREFAHTLARQLKRPAFFKVPKFGLRMVLGEMADQTLLASQRVEPRVLKQTKYPFQSPTLTQALCELLG